MTDEEIPPRGEISEYEESNTSSFVSEDSVTFPHFFNSSFEILGWILCDELLIHELLYRA